MAPIVVAYNKMINGMRYLAGILIFIAFVLIVLDVFIRLAGLQPWLYSTILVEYGLLWFTMLAAPYLVRIKGHVFIDAITQLLPHGARQVLAKISYLACVTVCAVFCYYSFRLFVDAFISNEIDTRAVDMPQWTLLLPIPICFALVTIEFGRYLVGIDSMYGDRTDVKDNV